MGTLAEQPEGGADRAAPAKEAGTAGGAKPVMPGPGPEAEPFLAEIGEFLPGPIRDEGMCAGHTGTPPAPGQGAASGPSRQGAEFGSGEDEDHDQGLGDDEFASLDERDWEVLQALARGESHVSAAARVGRKPKWVQRRLKVRVFARALEELKRQRAAQRVAAYDDLDGVARVARKFVDRFEALADSDDPALVLKVGALLLRESAPRQRFHFERSLDEHLQAIRDELRADKDPDWGPPDGGRAA